MQHARVMIDSLFTARHSAPLESPRRRRLAGSHDTSSALLKDSLTLLPAESQSTLAPSHSARMSASGLALSASITPHEQRISGRPHPYRGNACEKADGKCAAVYI